jgi:hypothetical protein
MKFVITAALTKSIIFWDVTPCSLVEEEQHFGERTD